jgi:predicted O-methyltransferase YrrM
VRIDIRGIGDRALRRDRGNYPRRVAVSDANAETVKFISATNCRNIAEFGIYEGHTSLKFAEFLGGEGELHLFDYQDRVEDVARKLHSVGYTNVRTFGSSYKLMDSYNWTLGKLLEENSEPIYDYVFLDGAHTWAVDALTTFLIDRLLKPGGFIDFDDYDWTLATSPALNPSRFPLTGKMYTDEQIRTKQVKMICDAVVRNDPRYREIIPNKIFQKSE